MNRVVWLVAVLGAVAGGVVALATLLFASSAMQELAGYAMASTLALVPYVLARAVDAMSDHQWQMDLSDVARLVRAARSEKPPI